MSALVEEKRMFNRTPPALPQQQDDGRWAITCLRCTSTSATAQTLSRALVSHTRHRCT